MIVVHKLEELSYGHSEYTLLWVESHVIFPHLVENLFEVLHMLTDCLKFHHYVVNVNLHTSTDLASKDSIHEALISSFSVLETERHYVVAKLA